MTHPAPVTGHPAIKTFRQYVEDAHRRAARKHGIPVAEATRELPEHQYTARWRDHVITAFNDGADIPTALWRSFDEGLQHRVLRSPRALRDDTLTHTLRGMTVPE